MIKVQITGIRHLNLGACRFSGCWSSELGASRSVGSDGIDIHPSSATIKAHRSLDQRENRVIAPEADVFPGQKFCPALAHNDIAGHDHLAAEFFHTEPLADAVAPVFNAALSFFVSHWEKLVVVS